MLIRKSSDDTFSSLDPVIQRVLEDESKNLDASSDRELSLRYLGPERARQAFEPQPKRCSQCKEILAPEMLRYGICLCGMNFKEEEAM